MADADPRGRVVIFCGAWALRVCRLIWIGGAFPSSFPHEFFSYSQRLFSVLGKMNECRLGFGAAAIAKHPLTESIQYQLLSRQDLR
jgi:hypothetical protein